MRSGLKITVFANGRARQVPDDITLGELADGYQLNHASVLVELNGEALHKGKWPAQPMTHGDRVEFIRVVAGG